MHEPSDAAVAGVFVDRGGEVAVRFMAMASLAASSVEFQRRIKEQGLEDYLTVES